MQDSSDVKETERFCLLVPKLRLGTHLSCKLCLLFVMLETELPTHLGSQTGVLEQGETAKTRRGGFPALLVQEIRL